MSDVIESVCSDLGEYVRPAATKLLSFLSPLANPSHHQRQYNRGFLLHGPSGVGKTKLIQTCVEGNYSVVLIEPGDIFRVAKGAGESWLADTFLKQYDNDTVFVIDNIDTFNDESILSVLLTCMDENFEKYSNTKLIGITHAISHVCSDLLVPKRLGTVFCMTGPIGSFQRKDLLTKLVGRHPQETIPSETLDIIAARTHGFLPTQLEAVIFELCSTEQSIGQVLDKHVVASLKDSLFQGGRELFRRENKIGGLVEVKRKLETSILLPLREPERLLALGLSNPPRGILLYGPSGNGKSLLAQNIGYTVDIEGLANVVSVQCQSLVSKVVGDSEARIVEMFRRAVAAAPCVLFLDQIDAIATKRGYDSSSEQSMDRMLSCLLTEMDGISSKLSVSRGGVIVLATTSTRERLDPTILRPGRFDQHILVGPPETVQDREDVLRTVFSKTPFTSEEVKNAYIRKMAETATGKSAAELVAFAREEIMKRLREDITCAHFL